MKRILALMFAACFVFGVAAQASALEINVKGDFHFAFIWQDKAFGQFNDGNGGTRFGRGEEDTFLARQRVRLQVEFIASENLKGVLALHSGSIWWGDRDSGGQLDTNRNTLKTRMAYVDWNVPDTMLNLKMGLQMIGLPGAVAGSPVLNTPMAGVSASYQFTDYTSATLFWARPWNNASDTVHDAWDMFGLIVPIGFDGFTITPWGEFSLLGRNVEVRDNADTPIFGESPFEKKAKMWHAGIAVDVDHWDPLFIKADFIWGQVRANDNGRETSGYFADLKIGHHFDWGTLALAGWYASGNKEGDSRDNNGKGKFHTMPSFTNTFDHESGWGMSSLGFWGNYPRLTGSGFVSQSGVGTAGVGIMLEDFSFYPDLTHTARALYYVGTSQKEARGLGFVTGTNVPMTKKDNAWELNLDSKYQIAKGFAATLDMGVVYVDWQGAYERENDDLEDCMWRVGLGVEYSF